MNYEKIQQLIDSNKVEKMKFYKAINLTHAGFAKMMKDKTLKVETLELIAKYFSVSIDLFFERKFTIDTEKDKEITDLLRENRQLRIEIERLKENENDSVGHGIPKLTKQKK